MPRAASEHHPRWDGAGSRGSCSRCFWGCSGWDWRASDAQRGKWGRSGGCPMPGGIRGPDYEHGSVGAASPGGCLSQLEWSHGKLHRQPERFRIDFHRSNREGCHGAGKQPERSGGGRKNPPRSSSSLSKAVTGPSRQRCPREAGQGWPGTGPVSPWWTQTPFPSVRGLWPGFLSRVPVALTGDLWY